MNSEKTQSKSHHFEHDEGDVDSGRRAAAEVGGQRDGDVGVVGGRKVGDVGVVGGRRVGDVGVVGDWRAGDVGIDAVRVHSKKIAVTDTTQNKSGKTKRGKTAVMFSSDKEDNKRKTKFRKRRDEDEEDDGSQAEKEDEEEEDEEEEEEDEEDKEDREEQKEMKQMEKSLKKFSKRVNVKLPKVELPKYDGTVTEWMSFRDFFGNAVHQNSALSKIDKF